MCWRRATIESTLSTRLFRSPLSALLSCFGQKLDGQQLLEWPGARRRGGGRGAGVGGGGGEAQGQARAPRSGTKHFDSEKLQKLARIPAKGGTTNPTVGTICSL